MKLSKDKTELRYNDFLLLRGIPAGVYDYRLGNRSALEWVIDQYQVSTDKRSGIVNDPNREDDPKYILRLIGQVITVSLETNAIIAALPSLGLPDAEPSTAAPSTEAAEIQSWPRHHYPRLTSPSLSDEPAGYMRDCGLNRRRALEALAAEIAIGTQRQSGSSRRDRISAAKATGH